MNIINENILKISHNYVNNKIIQIADLIKHVSKYKQLIIINPKVYEQQCSCMKSVKKYQ
jgi:hypothetical protein